MYLIVSGNLNLKIKGNQISSSQPFMYEQTSTSIHLYPAENKIVEHKCFISKLFSCFYKEKIGFKDFFLSEKITSLNIVDSSEVLFLTPVLLTEISLLGSSKLKLVESISTVDITLSGHSSLSIAKIKTENLNIKCSDSSKLFIFKYS